MGKRWTNSLVKGLLEATPRARKAAELEEDELLWLTFHPRHTQDAVNAMERLHPTRFIIDADFRMGRIHIMGRVWGQNDWFVTTQRVDDMLESGDARLVEG